MGLNFDLSTCYCIIKSLPIKSLTQAYPLSVFFKITNQRIDYTSLVSFIRCTLDSKSMDTSSPQPQTVLDLMVNG